MTNVLEVSAGRILIKDTNGDAVFDSNERLFVATDYQAGSLVTAVHTATASGASRNHATDIDIDTDTVLASINAAADTIFGAFKVTVSGFTPMGAGGWFQATGSYLHGQFTMGDQNQDPNTHFNYISGAVVYTFRASGGQLIFNERVFMRCTLNAAGTASAVMPATTVDYKLYCGSYV